MAFKLIQTVGMIYISLNVIITIIVSIFGAKYVRAEFILQKEKATQQPVEITLEQTKDKDYDTKEAETVKETNTKPVTQIKKMSFIKLWLKIVWKMRSVYVSLAVHIFDVLTDILVLIEWWYLEKNGHNIEHIDSRLMALCAIITLVLHKTVSTFAFWIKEKSVYRCLLQLFDVLIFEEIYISHQRVLNQFKKRSQTSNDSDTKHTEEAVETTTTFKYVRSLEAVFESIPQSVLQLVFIIRAGEAYYGSPDLLIISYFSIFQSIVSMTNSIIKNDNVYMTADKWKKHRQRLPPTIQFIKHAFCRLSEVVYRITLLALFWSVCGGVAFSALLAAEVLLILVLSFDERMSSIGVEDITSDEIFLRIQMLVILPSELVFAADARKRDMGITNCGYHSSGYFLGLIYALPSTLWTCCCCFWPAVLLTRGCPKHTPHYIHPDFRIGISIMEYIILIVFGITFEDKHKFLFQVEHGFTAFILGCVAFIVYTQYLRLFPNFALPFGVGIRSRYGYALIGELEELQRIKENGTSGVEFDQVHFNRVDMSDYNFDIDKAAVKCKTLFLKHINRTDVYNNDVTISDTRIEANDDFRRASFFLRIRHVLKMSFEEWDLLQDRIQQALDDIYGENVLFMQMKSKDINPWDIAPARAPDGATCTMFALANGHLDIVEWLVNEKGVRKHRHAFKQSKYTKMDSLFARKYIDARGDYF